MKLFIIIKTCVYVLCNLTDWLTDKVSYVECSFVRDIFTNKISSLSYIAAEEFRVTDDEQQNEL